MAKADLTAARLRELLHYDPTTGVFTRKVRTSNRINIGDAAGSMRPDGYLKISVLHASFLAHRLAWLYVHGEWPPEMVDHINGIKTDNRAANLRSASPLMNVQNQRDAHKRNRSSGLLGVTWDARKSKWAAQIKTDRQRHIGYFDTPGAASAAYLERKRALHLGCTI